MSVYSEELLTQLEQKSWLLQLIENFRDVKLRRAIWISPTALTWIWRFDRPVSVQVLGLSLLTHPGWLELFYLT